MKAITLLNQLRPISVGFDNVFDQFERMFDDGFFRENASPFPPFNIVKTGDQLYIIELALAGYNKKDISVDYADSLLTIKSVNNEDKELIDNVIHQGIAKRHFKKTFTISDDVEVKDANLKDGLLKISLKRIIPEGKKAKTIEIK